MLTLSKKFPLSVPPGFDGDTEGRDCTKSPTAWLVLYDCCPDCAENIKITAITASIAAAEQLSFMIYFVLSFIVGYYFKLLSADSQAHRGMSAR